MQELLNNPVVQGGIAPFLAGLLTAFALYRVGALQGLALLVGFLVTSALTVGLIFDPLTSTRKIILLIMFLSVVSLFLPRVRGAGRAEIIFICAVVAGLVWVMWPFLSRQSLTDNLIVAGGSLLFAVWISWGLLILRQKSGNSAGTAVAALALALGGTATIGASALYGQMAMSIGAAAMAYLLVQLLTRSAAHAGWVVVAIGGAAVAIIGPAAAIYAKVPWLSLLSLAFVPLLAQLEIAATQSALKRTIVLLVVYMIPGAISMGLALYSAGPVPF